MAEKELKVQLHQHCFDWAQEKLEIAQKALNSAREATHTESKSTAGDKHETGRAMMQLEQEKAHGRLAEASKLLRILDSINPNETSEVVGSGSLVQTSQGFFYLAIGLGRAEVEGKSYFVISPLAPIGQAMMGKRAGEQLSFNGRHQEILAVS